jgi:diguanylate cyclase (GGDEF)-like protein
MVHEKTLSSLLSEFARTLATDFPIQGILDHLVARIVDVLPITAAGVTLIAEGRPPQYIAASDANALRYEALQSEIGEGPCLAAYRTGEAVAVPDLANDSRFARFGPPAVAAGLGAVFTFPLRHGGGRLGALDLYRETPGEMDADDMAAAQTLADVTVAYLLNAQARDDAQSTSERFRQSSLHDPLTGLPNRLLLQQRIEHAAQRAQRSQSYAAVLFADLDGFKRVNDLHGHQVGDELLLAVAMRLSNLVRPGDTLCRYAGDEFVFLCEDLADEADAEVLALRVDDAFAEPFLLGLLEISMTASVGMAFAGPSTEITDRLVVEADTAMYQAKRKGGAAHQIIDLREASAAQDRVTLESDLREAFGNGLLDVAYQPIVRSSDGLITGVEALLRWNHALRGPIPAVWVIGIAEQSALITEIGQWVLARACRDHAGWPRLHRGVPLDLAVNVSARQLMAPGFCGIVADVLNRTRMDPAALVLEMTEYILIEDSDRAMTVLSDLKTLGIRIALDDFGTGYSSLSYLERLPIDILKVDQGFVAKIGAAPSGRAIVAAVTNLAHVLGLSVTAEGVETQAQRDAVATIGCESAQGFYYAEPMSAEAIGVRLATAPTIPVHLPTAHLSAVLR